MEPSNLNLPATISATRTKQAGTGWVRWKIEDALSLHPNYINLLGYQGADALEFLHERGDLVDEGLRRMGYRSAPTHLEYPSEVTTGKPFTLDTQWVNLGTGRVTEDYELQFLLVNTDDRTVPTAPCGTMETTRWIAGETYGERVEAIFGSAPADAYELAIRLHAQKRTGRLRRRWRAAGPRVLIGSAASPSRSTTTQPSRTNSTHENVCNS